MKGRGGRTGEAGREMGSERAQPGISAETASLLLQQVAGQRRSSCALLCIHTGPWPVGHLQLGGLSVSDTSAAHDCFVSLRKGGFFPPLQVITVQTGDEWSLGVAFPPRTPLPLPAAVD